MPSGVFICQCRKRGLGRLERDKGEEERGKGSRLHEGILQLPDASATQMSLESSSDSSCLLGMQAGPIGAIDLHSHRAR